MIVERELQLCAWHIDVACRDVEWRNEARELHSQRQTHLVGTAAQGVRRLHILVTECECGVECLHTTEEVAVLITHGGAQSVEARCGATLKLDVEALLERGRAEDVALQATLADVLEVAWRVCRATLASVVRYD